MQYFLSELCDINLLRAYDDALADSTRSSKRTAGTQSTASSRKDIQWVRGTATPTAILLDDNNNRTVSFTTGSGFTNGSSGLFQQLPESDFSHSIYLGAAGGDIQDSRAP